jgi:subfamily B ATP-binding cassette protein MsbA
LQRLLRQYFGHFFYFYHYLGYRIFIAVGLSLLVGVLDGFGLAMFLPLLQMVEDSSQTAGGEQMGNMAFLVNSLQALGLELNLRTILLFILVFFSLKGLAKFGAGFYNIMLQQVFFKKIRLSNVDLLTNYRYDAFVQSDSGRIQNTLSGEVARVFRSYRSYFKALQDIVLVLVYVYMAFLANPQFAFFVAVGGALTNFVYIRIYRITKQQSRSLTQQNHAFQGLLIQQVAFFKYLKATGFIHRFAQRLKKAVIAIEVAQRRIGVLASALSALREPLTMLVIVVVILLQVQLFGGSLGPLILSLLFFYRSLTFLMSAQSQWNNFLAVSGSLENMRDFSEELGKLQEMPGKIKLDAFREKMEIRNLDFSYGKEKVLGQVSLTIKKNETIALVGESGSGKTTLMNILCGLLPPEKPGTYFIDGIDTRQINMVSFQQRIGYITQEPVIFDDTIYNNVTLWAPDTPENRERFVRAAEMAAIADFIRDLPQQERTSLGNNGIMVSGGQKQRIAIARELFKEVDILMMDEATSALDSETEKSIQENITQLKGHYTMIIIAHRLSTVRHADRIYLLDQGEVRAEGSFFYLQKHSDAFRQMVKMQVF